MVKSEYYRRQAGLCRQLALVQRDQKAAIWLIEFAQELMTRAEAAAAFNRSSSDHVPDSARTQAAAASL